VLGVVAEENLTGEILECSVSVTIFYAKGECNVEACEMPLTIKMNGTVLCNTHSSAKQTPSPMAKVYFKNELT